MARPSVAWTKFTKKSACGFRRSFYIHVGPATFGGRCAISVNICKLMNIRDVPGYVGARRNDMSSYILAAISYIGCGIF